MEVLNKKVNWKKIVKIKKICIIRLGYVGMPLVYEFSKYFNVVGYDITNNN